MLSHANLERQLLTAQTAKTELKMKLREKELLVERSERDRRWFADREKEEREEKEKEREEHNKVTKIGFALIFSKVDAENHSLRISVASLQQEFDDAPKPPLNFMLLHPTKPRFWIVNCFLFLIFLT